MKINKELFMINRLDMLQISYICRYYAYNFQQSILKMVDIDIDMLVDSILVLEDIAFGDKEYTRI